MTDPKAPQLMCGECGCIHRPGENTLCPGWRPGPFVPDAKAPEMPTEQWAVECCHVIGDGAHYLEPRVLQRLVRIQLAMQGLYIVSEADKRVLEAVSKMKLVKETTTRPPFVDTVVCRGGGQAVVDAEWRRRTP